MKLQLSLRELFLLIAVAAMACGWWIHAISLRSQLREALWWKSRCDSLQFAVENEGVSVTWHDDWVALRGQDGVKGWGSGTSIDEPDSSP